MYLNTMRYRQIMHRFMPSYTVEASYKPDIFAFVLRHSPLAIVFQISDNHNDSLPVIESRASQTSIYDVRPPVAAIAWS